VTPNTTDERLAELERLRERVTELEQELIEVQAWANETVGASQAQAYWLDRWHLDLNALMERPWAGAVLAALRALRALYRRVLQLKRRWSR
jgi:hypothetical protein